MMRSSCILCVKFVSRQVSMQKGERLDAISSLLAETAVGSQVELASMLSDRGFPVTQASVSRDLDELGAQKVHGAYRLPARSRGSDLDPAEPRRRRVHRPRRF